MRGEGYKATRFLIRKKKKVKALSEIFSDLIIIHVGWAVYVRTIVLGLTKGSVGCIFLLVLLD
jgi:hypothetical protein